MSGSARSVRPTHPSSSLGAGFSDTMSDDECGVEQGNGELCDNPVKYADGKCGVHTDVTDSSPGRPTKFNDKRAQLAIEAALEGKSVAGCERAAGVGQKTIGGWLEQNHTFETDEGLIADFSQAFAQARAKGESRCIKNARREDGDASFEKFMLASSYDYKKTERVEADVDQTTTHELADDDRDAALKAIRTLHE